MKIKDVRITARVPIETFYAIQKAASIMGVPINAYIVQVAHEAALQKIDSDQASSITLSKKDANWFLEQLERKPQPNQKLIKALYNIGES